MIDNQYTDLERLEIVARRIQENQVDITNKYDDWIKITLACASLGEAAREAYHTICSLYPNYSLEECDAKFDNCLKTGRGMVTLGTVMQYAKDAGIDVRMPSGRRSMTAQQKEEQKEDQKNRITQMTEMLRQQNDWRFNIWRQRPEVKEPGKDWRPLQDRDLDTFYCRLIEQGLKVKLQDVKAMIFSRDFCPDYDPFRLWLEGLKPWNPETDLDYLRDFYLGHLEFNDPENEPFYDRMLKKWHVGMVALILGRIQENPQMPIFKGPQHIGKTFFARHILPPHLTDYRLEVGPCERLDKDFIISLSETPLILFDEIAFGCSLKNEAFKYIVTSSRSNVRDAYAHFREPRERRASLVATTNEECFITSVEGNRRYLVVDLKETVDLENFPLPYEGAYAQALYLLNNGFQPKPDQEESEMISQHNLPYLVPNDVEEALRTFVRQPSANDNAEAYSAGDLLRELVSRGYHGRQFTAIAIGKSMKNMGFESKKVRGTYKYIVVLADYDRQKRERIEDAYDEDGIPF